MKKFYLGLFLLTVISMTLQAQEVMVAPGDSTLDAAVFEAAQAGTLSTTTFVLQRGGEYIIGDRINNEVNDVAYDLTIVAADGAGSKPICRPKFGNDRPFDLDGANSTVTLTGLFITGISTDPDDIQDNHMIRLDGDSLDVIIDDCHIDGNYRSGIQVRNDGGSLIVRNSIISNIVGVDQDLDDPRGMGIRLSGETAVTVENTSFYNMDDSGFTNTEGVIVSPININNCTFANIGQDAIRIDEASNATITNSMFVNVGIIRNLNQTADSVFVIQIQDSTSTNYTISNNTVFIDTTTYLDSFLDTLIQVKTLNSVAAAVADETTFISEAIEFNNLPDGFDTSASDKSGWNTTSLDGDFGYSQEFVSYTGGIDGAIIGDTNWTFEEPPVVAGIEDIIDISIYPNPAKQYIAFNLGERTTQVQAIEIVNFSGRLIGLIEPSNAEIVGSELRINVSGLSNGLYFARIQMNNKEVLGNKFIVLK
ncbi:MAG: T9SS type A sorting domain-containing protein [Bacteroidota bacterium]